MAEEKKFGPAGGGDDEPRRTSGTGNAAAPSSGSRAAAAAPSSGSDAAASPSAPGKRSGIDFRNFMPEHINKEITRRYNIDKCEIGAGGYGKVYIAKDRHFEDRLVAIKKVVKHDAQKTAAFKREIQIMKELDHPNICKLLETYEQGRFMFFVMEYCEGREVFDRIMDTGLIEEGVTSDIVKQVSTALKYAHSRGIAHRDMKPENVVFCSADITNTHVKVIDWGLGFYFGQARMKSAVGSLTYAAPEVLEARENEEYSASCDLWSLGVVAYVMLCGKPPFWGNHNEQLRSMKSERYPITGEPWDRVSSHAKDFIRKLLKKKPDARMSIDKVLQHTWLTMEHSGNQVTKASESLNTQVLQNLKDFSQTSHFFSICVASVARQLDHRHLREIHLVFREMDTNGDGVLELDEIKAGFKKIYGISRQEELVKIEEMFAKLDLDGSGTIDYTEFCAAGLGEKATSQEYVLWAAFKTFDVHEDDGKITKAEIMQVLKSADVNSSWGKDVCAEVCQEIMDSCDGAAGDGNGDGEIDFEEWVKMMRNCSSRKNQEIEGLDETGIMGVNDKEVLESLAEAQAKGSERDVYDALTKLHALDKEGDPEPQPVRPAVEEKSPKKAAPNTGRAQEVPEMRCRAMRLADKANGNREGSSGRGTERSLEALETSSNRVAGGLCAEGSPCVVL